MKRRINQRTVAERIIDGGRELTLELSTDDHRAIPAALLLPSVEGLVPGAVLVHGYSSRKEHLTESIGRALLERGIASLAIDLPLHGTRREAAGLSGSAAPMAMLQHWRAAQQETKLALGYMRARPEVDSDRVALLGYSLGSFLATVVAGEDKRVPAVVVAAGGDLPAHLPFASMARAIVDPLRAVRKLAGRPLLIVHGKRDRTVLPEQAQRLFDAAGDPREIRWFDAGHHLPASASIVVAEWLVGRLS